MARVVWGTWELNVHGAVNTYAIPYSSANDVAQKDFNDPKSRDRERSLSIDLRNTVSVSSIVELSGRLYGDLYDHASNLNTTTLNECFYRQVRTCRFSTLGMAKSAGLELQSSFDWFKTAEFVTLLGADGRLRHVFSQSDLQDYDTGKYLASSYGLIHESDATLGVYLQQTWQPTQRLSLNGGVRLDMDRRFSPVPSPRVAASAIPWRNATLKVIYSEAFRAPSYFETNYKDETHSLANNLQPERVRNVEGVFEQRAGAHRIFAGPFATWWRDLVQPHVFSEAELADQKHLGNLGIRAGHASQFQNISRIDEIGWNAGFDGVLAGKLRYGGSATGAFARYRTDTGDELLPVAPQLFGNLHLSYELGGSLPTFGLAAHYMNSRPADRAISGHFTPTPYAPPLAEIRGTISGAFPFVPGLSYRLSANYVTAPRGPYVVGPYQDSSAPGSGGNPASGFELNPVDRFRATVGLSYVFGR
jgi:hypothetical protein